MKVTVTIETQADANGSYPMKVDFEEAVDENDILRAFGLLINSLMQSSAKVGFDAGLNNEQRTDIMFPKNGYGETKAPGLTSTFDIGTK